MEKNKQPMHKLEKIGKNKYRLTTEFERVQRVDEFNDDFLRESYRGGVKEYNSALEQLKLVNKKMKESEFSKDEVLRIEEFVELNNKAAKYNEYKKAEEQRTHLLDMIDRLRQQKEDIEKVAPEVKRLKK